MTDLRKQIADSLRHLQALAASVDAGKAPELCDINLFRDSSERVIDNAREAFVESITTRTPAEDKAAQRFVETVRGQADRA